MLLLEPLSASRVLRSSLIHVIMTAAAEVPCADHAEC